jgi:hypothetical protein
MYGLIGEMTYLMKPGQQSRKPATHLLDSVTASERRRSRPCGLTRDGTD